MDIENRKLYAYLNIDNPMVAWEVAIGRIQSICDKKEFGVSVWFYNLVKGFVEKNNNVKITNEFKLELARIKMYPEKVSRLQGVYFFESREMAEIAVERWGIPSRKKYITEVYFSGNNYTEVDSEWITTYLGGDPKQDPSWIESYWKGETLGIKPLTEVLASGIGIVHDQAIRCEAYWKIIDKWPTTSFLLNGCMAGFNRKGLEQIGRSIPTIFVEKGEVVGKYYIDMNEFDDHQDKIIDAMQELTKKGIVLPNIIPNDDKSFFSLPDFRDMSFSSNDTAISALLTEIHGH
ncbi:TPA: hypothetical protein ACPZCB_004356 [Yersinia enterocolitica]|nr:hypothetical protein [Yersinia enterocolitica]HDL7852005.1 hypothetical protein [Yersinia enterocolitica]HDL7935897.1 hypothetical protein [Yersinia enterocolitica]HDL7986958.1 hypothetical protein [Yersinia enterocolitica]